MHYEQLGGTNDRLAPEEIAVRFEVPISDVPFMIGEKLEEKLDKIAQEAISQEAKLFYKKLHDTSEKAGTAVSAGGKPISGEMLLQVFSTTETEFGPDGRPTSTLVIHPDMEPSLRKAAEEIENDPELRRRSAEILERQREAWLTRQSNRKLVD